MTLPVSDSSPDKGCDGFAGVACDSVAAFWAASNSSKIKKRKKGKINKTFATSLAKKL